MRRAIALVAIGAATLVGTSHESMAKPKRPPMRYASPAAIVAAEVAFSQLAQSKGHWTAFRATAAPDAVMFVPQPVLARDWLKSQKDPARSVAWQPHQVWLSCDGSLAVSYGAWQQPRGSQGYFTTVWQRQKNGEYKWVMDQGHDLPAPLVAPEMIGSGVATCDRNARPTAPVDPKAPRAPAPAFPAGTRGGWSDDRTLSWQMVVDRDCGRTLTVSLYRGAGKPMEAVLNKQVPGKPSTACPAS
jgi:hypothetical protein